MLSAFTMVHSSVLVLLKAFEESADWAVVGVGSSGGIYLKEWMHQMVEAYIKEWMHLVSIF